MLTGLLITLALAAPVLDVRPAFEVRAEPPKDDEQRALYDAYLAWLEAYGPLESPVLTFREVRQPFLGKRRLFVATGVAKDGHQPLRTLWLVRDKKDTLVLTPTVLVFEGGVPRVALGDVRLCPLALIVEEAKPLGDGGLPEFSARDTACTSVMPELRRAAVPRTNQAALAEALVVLLAALVDASEPGVVVVDAATLPRGYLEALAGRVSPGFQRFAPRASAVSPFFTTSKDGKTTAQGLVRSGRSARILETVSLEVTADKLDFTREQLAAQILQ